MALHNYLRNPATIAFDNNTLQTPIGASGVQAASVLLRTVSLYALTYRENANANAMGGPILTPEHLKLFSSYDCLFPFSNNGVSFPGPRNHNNIDLIIANNEFGVVIPPAPLVVAPATLPTVPHYIAFMNAVAGGGRGATQLGQADINNVIPVDDEDVTALEIHNFYNDYANDRTNIPALNPVMNFFDEVNVVHYIHKVVARNNINITRAIGVNPNPNTIKINVSNQGPTTTMPIQRSGNFEGALVGSWGAYGGAAAHIARESSVFLNLRNQLAGIIAIGLTLRDSADVTIFRDLYRLECIREPAALLTNAMFVNLATVNYTSVNNDIYNFVNIRDRMPMAPAGTVNATRVLWSLLITAHDAINNHIYYRYDYAALAGLIPDLSFDLLTQLENNLLFNYIMRQADQLDTANPGAGNITARLRTNVLTAGMTAVNQQAAFAGGVNPWLVVMGPHLAGIASIYQVTVPVGGGRNIVFEARFPIGGAPIQATDIFITSFPLALINQLLLDWYQVDIGLAAAPNQNIQINLQLRA